MKKTFLLFLPTNIFKIICALFQFLKERKKKTLISKLLPIFFTSYENFLNVNNRLF